MIDFGVTEQKVLQLERQMAACGLRESDLQESFVRSSGPGGQRVNKSNTCVRLKHLPSGLQVKMQKERTQRLNRFFARRRMCELLEAEHSGGAEDEKAAKIRKQKDRRRRRAGK